MTKSKILVGIAVVAVAAAMALNVNFRSGNSDLSDILLANVEALAKNEEGNNPGTLMDIIQGGTHVGVCCCPGSSTCAASKCPESSCSS